MNVQHPASMEVISIAIASIGRPSLADMLHSLTRLTKTPATTFSVLVADDSRDAAAARVIEEADLGDPPVTCLSVASGNISAARNALLNAAHGDWIALVDDDEWVEPDWLLRLLTCARKFEADVIIGHVFLRYPDSAPDWLVRANPLYDDFGYRDKRLSTGRGGNTLLKIDLVRRLGLRFDPALGVTGGGDTAFFAAASARGARIFATDDAIAHEHVPQERLMPSYILSRAVRSGQSSARGNPMPMPAGPIIPGSFSRSCSRWMRGRRFAPRPFRCWCFGPLIARPSSVCARSLYAPEACAQSGKVALRAGASPGPALQAAGLGIFLAYDGWAGQIR